MPLENLHMTAMEITHSLTASEIDALVTQLGQRNYERIADMSQQNQPHARLVKPMLSFDAAALALSFVPAVPDDDISQPSNVDDAFTYHHLRRELYREITEAGIDIASRYVVPSAHLTVGRFICPNPFDVDNAMDGEAGVRMENREKLMKEVEAINEWLRMEYWPRGEGNKLKDGGEWVVGERKGLNFRKGTLWYGGGETVCMGKGF